MRASEPKKGELPIEGIAPAETFEDRGAPGVETKEAYTTDKEGVQIAGEVGVATATTPEDILIGKEEKKKKGSLKDSASHEGPLPTSKTEVTPSPTSSTKIETKHSTKRRAKPSTPTLTPRLDTLVKADKETAILSPLSTLSLAEQKKGKQIYPKVLKGLLTGDQDALTEALNQFPKKSRVGILAEAILEAEETGKKSGDYDINQVEESINEAKKAVGGRTTKKGRILWSDY